jgi:Leucine-rich repeat (LRR) protein
MLPVHLLVLLIMVPIIASRCQTSYVTMCNNFADIANHDDIENCSELIIGSNKMGRSSKLKSVSFSDIALDRLKKIKILIIIQKINHLKQIPEDATYCDQFVQLDLLSLYRNELKIIERLTFPKYFVRKMSLIKNKIERIEVGAFEHHRIVDLDLSNNYLRNVHKGALPLTAFTKTITIRKNRLTKIEPGSFPSSLQTLNLNRNQLTNLSGVLDDLKDLRELTVSHNFLEVIPEMRHLVNLIILDLSFNEITAIEEGVFEGLNQMEVLDLTFNHIVSPSALQYLPVSIDRHLTASLALNNLRNVDLTNVRLSDVTLVLYGNPWNCTEWMFVKNDVMKYESECGLRFYSSGQTPYCLDYSNKTKSEITRHQIFFLISIKRNSHLIGCQLAPKKYSSICSHR